MDHPTGRQIAAARALAGISQSDLASSAHISVPTLKRMEATDGAVTGMRNNIDAVVRALEAAGVKFIDDGANSAAGGPGVRLSVPTTPPLKQSEVVQYPEQMDDEAGPGSGGANRQN